MTANEKPASGDLGKSSDNPQARFITDMIDRSFRGEGTSGASRTGRARSFLRGIMEHFGAEGIVFWRLEGPHYKCNLEQYHRLVSGVSVFRGRQGMPERLEMRNLPIESTSSGTAFSEKRKVFGRDEGGPNPDPEFPLPHSFFGNPCFQKREIRWMLGLPIASPETEVYGVLSLYWRDDQKQHALSSNHSFFDIAAALWPGVYQRIRESRRLQLITEVDFILGKSGQGLAPSSGLTPLASDAADEVMGKICETIGELLHAEEVSIFLTPLTSSEEIWSCRASNWKEKPEQIYQPATLSGITGWCLAHKKPIYIPDLHSFDSDKEWLGSVLSGDLSQLQWKDDLLLTERDAKEGDKPVRSFLAAPLVVEGVLVGVIRCTSKANSPLIYFSNEDRTSLEIVGTRIAQTWRNWQIAHAKNEQAKAWDLFNEHSREIPQILSQAINQQPPNFSLLEISVLSACRECLAPWGQGVINELPAAAETIATSRSRGIAFTENFVGAWDASPAHGIQEMAERQLSVYRTVCDLVVEVRTSSTVLKRALSDLRHQIINPLNKALLRANRHLKNFGHLTHVGEAVYPIRGLLRKSINVANAFHILVELETTNKLRIEATPLNPRKLYILLTEVVRDARLDFDKLRNLKINLQENFRKVALQPDKSEIISFLPVLPDLKVDSKLLEQTLNSIIENAGKYSNANNVILVNVQLSPDDLTIIVSSRGAKLLPEESVRVAERNYRSPTAIKYVGEGTGIGLFLVDAIAKAHGGSFHMTPTDEQGYTHAVFRIPAIH